MTEDFGGLRPEHAAVLDALPTIADADVPWDQKEPWLDPEGRIRADYLREDGKYRIVLLDQHSFSCPDHKEVTGGREVEMESHDGCEECAGGDDYGGDFCPLCSFCCGC